MCAMHTIDYLVTNYGTDDEVTKLLDEKTFYVIPRVTPDGAEKYLSTPYSCVLHHVHTLKKRAASRKRILMMMV